MRNKKLYLELMRIVACFFVIVNHTMSYVFWDYVPGGKTWCVSVFSFFLSKFSVPVFLMISGVVLLGKEDNCKKTMNRIKKTIIILVCASIIYYIYDCASTQAKFSIVEFVKKVVEGPLSNCLWYLYMYTGILLILPALQKMTKNMKKMDYTYLLASGFFVLSICPVIAHWVNGNGVSNLISDSMLSVYVLMVILGYYLENYFEVDSKIIKWMLIIILSETCINVGLTYIEWRRLSENGTLTSPNDYLFYSDKEYINVLVLSVCVYILFKYAYLKYESKLGEKLKNGISYLGSLTLGTYVMGDFWIKIFLPIYYKGCSVVHPVVSMVIVEIMVFITGMIITAVLKKIPVVKTIV